MSLKYSNDEIEKLILLISKLPGFGPKSASRAALHLLNRKDQLMIPLAESLIDLFYLINVKLPWMLT